MLTDDELLFKIDLGRNIVKRNCIITCKNYTIVPPQKHWINKTDPTINRIFYMTGGKGEYLEGDVRRTFETGKIYFIPSYSGIPTYTDDNDRLVHAFVNFKLSPPIVSKKVFCLDPSTSPKLEAAAQAFCALCHNEYKARTRETPLTPAEEQELALLSSLTVFLAESATSNAESDVINDHVIITALDIIHSSLSKKLTVEEIAKKCYMSTDGFIRKFTRYIGETPYSYIKNFKVRTALLIRSEGATLEEAAEACGYSDASALLHAISSFSSNSQKQFSDYAKNKIPL